MSGTPAPVCQARQGARPARRDRDEARSRSERQPRARRSSSRDRRRAHRASARLSRAARPGSTRTLGLPRTACATPPRLQAGHLARHAHAPSNRSRSSRSKVTLGAVILNCSTARGAVTGSREAPGFPQIPRASASCLRTLSATHGSPACASVLSPDWALFSLSITRARGTVRLAPQMHGPPVLHGLGGAHSTGVLPPRVDVRSCRRLAEPRQLPRSRTEVEEAERRSLSVRAADAAEVAAALALRARA